MELSPQEQVAIKALYSMYHANAIRAEQVLDALEVIFTNDESEVELTDDEASKVKGIYSMVDFGTMRADEAVWDLEQLINNNEGDN